MNVNILFFIFFWQAGFGIWNAILFDGFVTSPDLQGRINLTWTAAYIGYSLLLTLSLFFKNFFKVQWPAMAVICLFLIFGIKDLIVGSLNGNELRYLFGDAVRYFLFANFVFIGTQVDSVKLLGFLKKYTRIMSAVFLAGLVVLRMVGLGVVGVGSYYHLPAFIFALIGTKGAPLNVVSVLAVIFGEKRGVWIAVVGIVVFRLFGMKFRPRFLLKAVSILLFIVLAFAVSFPDIAEKSYDRVSSRLAGIVSFVSDGAEAGAYSRVQEVISSRNYMENCFGGEAVSFVLVGCGAGATYLNDSNKLRLAGLPGNPDLVHNIHFSPMTLTFRSGLIITILVYMLLIVSIVLLSKKSLSTGEAEVLSFYKMYSVGLIIFSFTGFSLIGEPLLPVLLGAVLSSRVKHET